MWGSTAATSVRMGRPVTMRAAEIAGQGVAEEVEILRPERAVEAEPDVQGGDGVGGGPVAEDGDGRVAGDDRTRRKTSVNTASSVGMAASRRRRT